jgi:heme O synthase-like polyprenyltransferase
VSQPSSSSPSKVRAYLQLFRLPNVFTAMADVLMGFLVTHGTPEPAQHFWPLLIASSLIYTAGMVLNDVYDLEIDLVERPARPLPSGRIKPAWAKWLGYEMLLIGVLCAGLVTFSTRQPRPMITAITLAAAVLLYDRILKKTLLGPVAMGSCRFLNVLLGMSAFTGEWAQFHWLIAAGVGLYIVGVTWFARTEATQSNRLQLFCATAVAVSGLSILASFPYTMPAEQIATLRWQGPERWQMLWLFLSVLIGWRLMKAIFDPSPQVVQFAIKQSILSLILIDAAVVFCFAGLFWSVVVLLLIVPAMFLGQWIYST